MTATIKNNQELLLQITSGQGPEEYALAVRKVFEAMSKEAARRGLTAEMLDSVPGRASGTYRSLLLRLSGRKAREFAGPWIGTIQWLCESPYRPGHERRSWFVGVSVHSAASAERLDVDPGDIAWKAVRASGPGGQHVNTTDSAVQAIHRPTGIRVTAAEERSQHANKKRALEKIRSVLSARIKDEKDKQAQKQWKMHLKLERGSPVKVFAGKEFRER